MFGLEGEVFGLLDNGILAVLALLGTRLWDVVTQRNLTKRG